MCGKNDKEKVNVVKSSFFEITFFLPQIRLLNPLERLYEIVSSEPLDTSFVTLQ